MCGGYEVVARPADGRHIVAVRVELLAEREAVTVPQLDVVAGRREFQRRHRAVSRLVHVRGALVLQACTDGACRVRTQLGHVRLVY